MFEKCGVLGLRVIQRLVQHHSPRRIFHPPCDNHIKWPQSLSSRMASAAKDRPGPYCSFIGMRESRLVILRFAPPQFHEGAQSCRFICIEPITGDGEVRHAVKRSCSRP